MSLKDKYLSKNRTAADGNNPRHRTVISRQKVPIQNRDFLVYSDIAEGTYSDVSVAVRRPDITKPGDMAYVAGITDGDAVIYTRELKAGKPSADAQLWHTISGATKIAIAFAGKYLKIKTTDRVEFQTVDEPYILWIDSSNNLYCRIGDTDTLVATSAAAVSATMGIRPFAPGIDQQGFLVAYVTTGGSLFYRQYDVDAGTWNVAVQITDADTGSNLTGVTDIAISRTWDYRIAFLYSTASGVYLQLTKAVPTGFANVESLQVDDITVVDKIKGLDHVAGYTPENIDAAAVNVDDIIYPADAPPIVSAENISDGGDPAGWGLYAEVTFKYPVGPLVAGSNGFSLKDTNDVVYACTTVAYKSGSGNKTLVLTIVDFNNADNDCRIAYDSTVGDLYSFDDVTEVATQEFAFTAVNLVPSSDPAPAPTGDGYNIDGEEI